MNTEELISQATSGKYAPHGSVSDGNCVISYSFGYQKDNEKIIPGLSNEDIADFIVKLDTGKPLILQFEIADALKDNTSKIYRISKHTEEGAYLDTFEVSKQAQKIMNEHQWNKAIIIAHPFHLPRVDAVCKKLGIYTIVPSGLEAIRFDPNSYQEWTRNKEVWTKREIEAINLTKRNGWI